ncbi:MAG: succinate dehydrogenase assembly factor 2 [Proteobacteria bacterium]|jgi:succinate dehydrogenase flavin-adding protein (antitoxin of CptAB toxin-antitoxin module)|nr:succinate dehydrogenase assembly factor 2 [Pseudomonadota bacterium]MBT5066022.1 succinate dehydrogenase assembly factor 2 [Pseudomonadota bacterium]MBT6193791.1 succinate dehydrogenase assembly factor 2 [Pseudomonadota bacterium]MBT6464681.1 succinate dehydrogenase assembly factor 2 [Pseudomonadota bacterium]MBT6673846.1 succinate dehydrogenase assembly factor 2 [Pseudomonadota bacterium]
MRELDVMLVNFLEREDTISSDESINTFQLFLDSSDMDLYSWLTRRSIPQDIRFKKIVEKMLFKP